MGVQKKEAFKPKTVPGNLKLKGENFYRDRKKVQYLNMLKGGRARYDSKGNLLKAAAYQSKEAPTAHIEPNRKWFGNTRVIGQKALEEFREQMATKINDPYQVLLRRSKLPTSLLHDNTKIGQVNMLQTEAFSDTFGPKAQRKRPKLTVEGYDQLVKKITDSEGNYDHKKDLNLQANKRTDYDAARDWYLTAGTSKRIWNELYKVVDSSDVILHVLDARDPEGTRCRHVEKYIKTEAPHKHLVYILNKVDLVPTWVTARWVKVLSREYPTLAFHASINHSFGKGSLIQLLRQFTRLHADKKQISVGLIGYPNTGKSSIINTLRQKKVCTVAPVPGETKVWQYITMTRRIYLIDCPGIVQFSATDTDTDIVLKGSIRTESLLMPEDYIPEILNRVRKEYIQRHYNIDKWDSAEDFLTELAKATGKLNKGGEPDLHVVSKMVVNDWVRGRLPHYRAPPEFSEPLARSQTPASGDAPESASATKSAAASDEVEMADGEDQDTKQKVTLASLNVNQMFSKIPVLAEYLPVDLEGDKELREQERAQKIVDTDVAAEKKAQKAKAGKTDSKRKRQEEVADEAEDDAGWDEVFQSAVNNDAAPEVDSELESGFSSAGGESEDESDAGSAASPSDNEDNDVDMAADQGSESEEDTKHRKKMPRMKTNKMKIGKHYYPEANIKNRNRNKVRQVAPEAKVKRMRMPGLWTVSKKK
ncbi:GTPase required for pre-60S ribosomal subunit nuclear export and maturation [Coemansia spiralis]|uniref:Nucleolar GTP-binding protein 2 n=2 Tax=Coemansia TaxID=4863 RepID=A0A9W8GGA8_9FUNG|nr:GTPase required for pre-60S ribosomal subunit nuclear export and maturation [Coemansia spiralis]